MNLTACGGSTAIIGATASVIGATASVVSAYFTITRLDDIEIYSRECGFKDLLIWFPDEGYRERWTEAEIKALLAANKTLKARCKQEDDE